MRGTGKIFYEKKAKSNQESIRKVEIKFVKILKKRKVYFLLEFQLQPNPQLQSNSSLIYTGNKAVIIPFLMYPEKTTLAVNVKKSTPIGWPFQEIRTDRRRTNSPTYQQTGMRIHGEERNFHVYLYKKNPFMEVPFQHIHTFSIISMLNIKNNSFTSD